MSGCFWNTAYRFYGLAGFDGRTVQPVLSQVRVADAVPATQIMIDTYMAALGFQKVDNEGRFSYGQYVVWDVIFAFHFVCVGFLFAPLCNKV